MTALAVLTVRPHEVEPGDMFLGSDVPVASLDLDCSRRPQRWCYYDEHGALIVRKPNWVLVQVQRPQGVPGACPQRNDVVGPAKANASGTTDSTVCLPVDRRRAGDADPRPAADDCNPYGWVLRRPPLRLVVD